MVEAATSSFGSASRKDVVLEVLVVVVPVVLVVLVLTGAVLADSVCLSRYEGFLVSVDVVVLSGAVALSVSAVDVVQVS